MKKDLVFMDAKSSKFWRIELAGPSFTVVYGRTGTDGQSQTKTFPTEEAARKEAEKLVKEKLGKGYVEFDSSSDAGAENNAGSNALIPLVAFSSIHRREEFGENAGTFIGKRVVDFQPDKSPKGDVIYRFRSDWENDELIPNLQEFLESDAASVATGLVIGSWQGDDTESSPQQAIDLLISSKDRLPNLRALYIGDITSEETEMSWIHQADLSPLFPAFPQLQLLRSRGGDGLELKNPSHHQLRGLAIETGGLNVEVIRAICTSDFPNLEYLELWLGTEEYGANHTVADLQPILSGRLFPKLKYLGLRNSQQVDDIAAVVVNSPIIHQIETLDLSLGVLTDEGGRALLKLPKSETLKRLNLHYNYLTQEVIRELKALPLIVDASKPSNMDADDDGEWRFVAVGE
ncbi:MAG: STM4015 family protein [Verrucomicrobiales bacterium]